MNAQEKENGGILLSYIYAMEKCVPVQMITLRNVYWEIFRKLLFVLTGKRKMMLGQKELFQFYKTYISYINILKMWMFS